MPGWQRARPSDARDAAMRALRCAATEHEVAMARNALRLVEEKRPVKTLTREPVVTPGSWKNPVGDRRVSGQLVEVECAGSTARLHLRTASETLILNVADPRKVVLRGSAQHSFACGPQQPGAVRVDFVESTNQVTALEFGP